MGAVAPETHATLQNLNIKTNSDYLCGIYIEGKQNNIEIKGKINIETTGLNACGIVNYSHEGKLDIANALINIKTEANGIMELPEDTALSISAEIRLRQRIIKR